MRVMNINGADNFSNCSFEAKVKLPREVILKYHNEGKTTFQIAKLLNCSSQAIRKIIKEEFKLDTNNPLKRGQILYSKDELIVLHQEGFTVKQIAQKWNAFETTVRNMLNKMGLKPNVLSADARAKFDKNEIKSLYEKGLKTKEIAEQLNCTVATVRRLLNEAGITLKRYSMGSTPQVSREEVAKLNGEGFTVTQIAKKMDCSYTLVSMILKKLGLEPNRVIKQPSLDRLQYTPQQVVEFYKSGMSLSEIGTLMGLHFSSVRNILLKENVELAKAGKPLKYSRNEFFKLHQDGLSIDEIADKIGCTPQYARKLHKNLGLLPNSKNPVPKFPIEQFVEQYKQGLSITQIAKMFGCCHDTVKRSLKKQGIKSTDRGSLLPEKVAPQKLGISIYSRDEILKLHKEGLTAVEIAKKMGASDGTIKRVLKILLNRPKDTKELKNQVLELYHQNIPINEIASKLDVKFDKVRKIIRDNNLIVQPSKTNSLQSRIKNYHLLGYNVTQISAFVRQPVATIKAIIADSENSLGVVQKAKVGRPKKINVEQVKPTFVNEKSSPFTNIELLLEQKYSLDEITRKLGKTPEELSMILETIHKKPFKAENFECVSPANEQGRLRVLVSRGDSPVQIAELYGVSANEVKNWLDVCVIDIPKDKPSPSKVEVEKVLKDAKQAHKPVGTVYNFGEQLGISKHSFEFLVEKYGLESLYWSIIRGL